MKITVFTPTYNRERMLGGLFDSLLRQTYADFEWLVVDDGSADGTDGLFSAFQARAPFPVRCVKQEHGGKCRAINRALRLAEGEFFFTADSDDRLTDGALERAAAWADELPGDCAGFFAPVLMDGVPTYPQLPGGYYSGIALDRYSRFSGELAAVFRTEVHRKYPYPVFDGEDFMTEAVAWNRMARDGYGMRFHSEPLLVCAYREDGLTARGAALFYENPRGTGLFLRERDAALKASWARRLRTAYTFCCDMAERLSEAEIAEAAGRPVWLVRLCLAVHRARNRGNESTDRRSSE